MLDLFQYSWLRSIAWRAGRRLYMGARGEIGNDPATNGEYWLLEATLTAAASEAPVLLDIGANRGDWSARAEVLLQRQGVAGQIHAFEPSFTTHKYLARRFGQSKLVLPHQIGLSDRSGSAEFYVVGELAGTNSLYRSEGAACEVVTTLKTDEFLEQHGISRVLMVKSDTEGHDMAVLLGAEEALRNGRVEVWQFEYNHRWTNRRALLRDVFEFVSDKPYFVAKLQMGRLDIIDRWHPELERFFEANYVLVKEHGLLETVCRRCRFDESNILVPVSCR